MQPPEFKSRILIVDDNPNIHRDFELVLAPGPQDQALEADEQELFGETGGPAAGAFELEHAFSGMEGVERVRQALAAGRNFQMAFVDIRMPGMDGVETIGRIWEIDPAIQVVICTAYADYSQEDLTSRLGQTDKLLVLKKPFDTLEVTQVASTLAAKWFLARQAALKMQQMELLVARRTEKVLDLQRREAQKTHELDQMKFQFLSNFAHEFRSPLTLVLAKVEQLLSEGRLKNHDQDVLRRNAERLLNLVNHLADMHLLDQKDLKPKLKPGNIVVFLQGIIQLFQPLALKQKLELEFQTLEDAVWVKFDSDILEKVLFLILSDALQTTPAGGSIVVRADLADPAAIVIENRGGRLPDGTENQRALWPTLARKLVEILSGNISLGSLAPEPAQAQNAAGYRFVISLHLEKVLQETEAPQVSAARQGSDVADEAAGGAEESSDSKETPNLLVIVADQELRLHISQSFESECRVCETANSTEAFQVAHETLPDLIISDVALAPLDGVELCARLRADDLTNHIPVILLAGQSDDQQQLRALEAGVDDFISKPFRMPLLKARVSNLLESRRWWRGRFSAASKFAPASREVAISEMDLQFLKRVNVLVEKNLSDLEFDMDALARAASVSRRQLFRKIKALIGTTPNTLIRSMRLERATQLLRESHLTVTEITYAVGFSDLKHFRELFHEKYGVLPGDYAARYGDKAAR